MTAPVFDVAAFGGDPEAPPVPMVIGWDDLDPAAYATILGDLSRWLAWFRCTYRIPATVFPPCWFTHPGLREDLGHLWTGWLVTQHPDAGVGMIGLDWDSRREQAITRLREATAITGCTASQHRDEPVMPGTDVSALWNDHISIDAGTRHRRETLRTTIEIVTEHLQAAELRHDLAPGLLSESAANPAAATADERAAVAVRLEQLAEQAAATVDRISDGASCAVTDQHELASRETALNAARRRVAEAIAIAGDVNGAVLAEARRDWLAAIENLVPAALAADRAADAAAARASTVDRVAGARRRHADIGSLLAAGSAGSQSDGSYGAGTFHSQSD